MPKGSWRSRMSKRERSSNFCETGSRLNGWPRRSEFRLALLVPMSGPAGIWGPSCIASAQTALEELNRSDGIAHLEVIPVAIDAAHESMDSLASLVDDMIADGEIDAIVGMHLSSVRQKLAKIIGCRVPYIYTPLYEGGERSPGVFAIGETPERQLAPALQVLSNSRKLRRWALIGNDYVWPRVSHHIAKKCLRELSAEVVMEQYVPLGHENMASLIEELSASNADSVVISLVGQNSVLFNRVFGEAGLDRTIVRLSCAIEENGLLAIGHANTKRLYSSSSYFAGLNTHQNQAFKERYYQLHGSRAPMLNTIGQSVYEGVQFLSRLLHGNRDQDWPGSMATVAAAHDHRSARVPLGGHTMARSTYLARADGLCFSGFEDISGCTS